MKQVTGNNISKTVEQEKNKILSIQLSLNGLSFSIFNGKFWSENKCCIFESNADILSEVKTIISDNNLLDDELVRIVLVVDTDKVELVPTQLYSDTYLDDMSNVIGVKYTDDLTVVVSSSVNGVLALMNFPRHLYDYFCNIYGDKIAFYHPLLLNLIANNNRSVVSVCFGDSSFHVTVKRDNKLLFADSFKYNSIADVIYVLNKLEKLFYIKNLPVLLSGKTSVDNRKILSAYYKKVILSSSNVLSDLINL